MKENLCVADADDLTKPKQREHSTQLQTRVHESKLKAISIKRSGPDLWKAISDLEPALLTFHPDGLRFQHKIYVGVDRAGSAYLNRYLSENHIAVSHLQMLVLRAMAFYKRFTTYDELFDYLKDENCGDLMPDRSESLDNHPSFTKEEEILDRPKLQEKRTIHEVDISLIATRNKISKAQAMQHFRDEGYEILR